MLKTSGTPHYENVPFEIPNSWCWAIGEEIFSPMQSTRPMGISFKYIDIDAIDNTKCKIQQVKTLETKDAPSRATRYTEIGDVLFSMVRPYLRNIAKVTESDCIASTGFFVCSTNGSIVADYCYYLMISDYVVNGLNQFMKGDNSPSINNKHIATWLYPIPPLAEQERIVAGIGKWFALIDQIEQGKVDLQTAIKQTKSKILDLAIHGKLVPQDPSDEPASELLKRINPKAEITCDNGHYQNLPFEVPQKWSWTTLGKIGKWQSGSTPSRLNKDYYNGDIPWLKTGDLNDGYITHIPEYITEKALNETSVKLNPSGSVLIAMYGATIGKIGILTYPATTNQACCACETFNGIDKEFLFFFLLSHRDEFIKMGGGGAQPNISKEKIINTYIPLPPFAEQKRIVNAIRKAFVQLDTIMESL